MMISHSPLDPPGGGGGGGGKTACGGQPKGTIALWRTACVKGAVSQGWYWKSGAFATGGSVMNPPKSDGDFSGTGDATHCPYATMGAGVNGIAAVET